jgi:hypothetical protein
VFPRRPGTSPGWTTEGPRVSSASDGVDDRRAVAVRASGRVRDQNAAVQQGVPDRGVTSPLGPRDATAAGSSCAGSFKLAPGPARMPSAAGRRAAAWRTVGYGLGPWPRAQLSTPHIRVLTWRRRTFDIFRRGGSGDHYRSVLQCRLNPRSVTMDEHEPVHFFAVSCLRLSPGSSVLTTSPGWQRPHC